ncbi:MAG: MlaA family lipoprotein [Betaproteobacteria bacterium]
MNTQMVKRLFSVALVVAVGGLSGCATTANNPKDPYEGFNRAMFQVNEGIDVVAKPVAQGYDAVAPLPVKAGVGNFFGNIADVWISINNLLQGKGQEGLSDMGRFLINTTVGIGGVFDIASEIGLEKHAEDFGQTLGKWGAADGPYFFWPIIGPRTTRDTFGWLVDTNIDPVWHVQNVPVRNSLVGIRFIDTRASLLPADKVVEQAAFDKYNYIRDAYLQKRFSDINDGKVSKSESE